MNIITQWLGSQHREEHGRCAVCKEVWPCAVTLELQRLAGIEQELTESHQRALDLTTSLEETDQRACAAEQQLDEQTAVVGALAEAAQTILTVVKWPHNKSCPHGNGVAFPTHAWFCDECFGALEQALAPEAVQKAVEASKAKDAEIETLRREKHLYKSGSGAEAVETKLAVATGLLEELQWPNITNSDGVQWHDCYLCQHQMPGHAIDCPLSVFLVDSSQAAAQYREAQNVVARVKAKLDILITEQAGDDLGILSLRVAFMELLNELLGDAAQNTPTGGVADVEALARRVELSRREPDDPRQRGPGHYD